MCHAEGKPLPYKIAGIRIVSGKGVVPFPANNTAPLSASCEGRGALAVVG